MCSREEQVKLGMAIKFVPFCNPQNPSHLKPEWVAKVSFKWVWGSMGKTVKDTDTGMSMSIGLTTPNPPHTRLKPTFATHSGFKWDGFYGL